MKLLLLFSTLILFSCQTKKDLLFEETWFPTHVETSYSYNSFRIHAMNFSDDSLHINTLGTDYINDLKYSLEGSNLELTDGQDTLNWEISVGSDVLIIRLDSVNAITYSNSIGPKSSRNFTQELDSLLLSNSWMLNDSVLWNFRSDLEIGLVLPQYHNELKNVEIHEKSKNYFNRHLFATWGTAYIEGYNTLAFVDIWDDLNSDYYIVESINEKIISGYSFGRFGDKERFELKAINDWNDTKSLILGDWKLSSYKEAINNSGFDYSEVWSTLGEERGINIEDLERKSLSLSFNDNMTFQITKNNDPFASGKWEIDKSGKLVKLIAEHKDGGTRTTFMTVIDADSSQMVVHKTEDIEKRRSEFEVKEFVQTYKKLIKSEE